MAAALSATRALLRARTPTEVALIVATLVHDLGGGLVPARLGDEQAMPLDVSIGTGEPLLPWADPLSIAAMRLATTLPPVVEDALLVTHRMGQATRLSEPTT